MEQTALFQKNLNNFLQSNPRFQDSIQDIIESAEKIADQSDGEAEVKEWRQSSEKAIILPQYIPRTEQIASDFESKVNQFKGSSILDYNDVHEDVHLYESAVRIRNDIKSSGFDPDVTLSLSGKNIPLLIALGTGDGRALLWFIQQFQPLNLIVIVPEWEYFVSSFNHIDWDEVNKYFSTPGKSISYLRPLNDSELISKVASLGYCFMEHAYIYKPVVESAVISDYHKQIIGRRIVNLVPYCGYTVDEYNMVLNTARNLSKKPKIFRAPLKKLNQKILVCASGPSLDKSIETIRKLSDDHIVICGGSNYKALTKNGIRVDCLVLIERADEVYSSYKYIYDNVGRTNTKLLMSSTCNEKLFELFDSVGVFYRPALTPVSMFSESKREVISHEGPQAVCAAISLACELGPSQLSLIGVDFGSTDAELQRSKDAVGYSPQKWSLKVPGNFEEFVHTNERLLDCRDAVQMKLRISNLNIPIYNMSNGILIEGATPISQEQYLSQYYSGKQSDVEQIFNTWWKKLPTMTSDKMVASWNVRNPRKHIFDFSRTFESEIDSELTLFPDKISKLESKLKLDQYTPSQEFPVRIMRGTFMKLLLMITQQYQIMKESDKAILDKFELYALKTVKDLLLHMEREMYSLCDLIDTKHL